MSKKKFLILRIVVIILIVLAIFLYKWGKKQDMIKANKAKREYIELVAEDMKKFLEENGEDAIYVIPDWLEELNPNNN